MVNIMSKSIVLLAKKILGTDLQTLPLKELVSDFNTLVTLTNGNTVKKFASKANGAARIIKLAKEIVDTHSHLLEEPKVKTTQTTRGLLVTIDGTAVKYGNLKASLIKNASEVVIGEGATEKQLEWLNSCKNTKRSVSGLKVKIDGVLHAYWKLTAAMLKAGKKIEVIGQPTEKQTKWLSNYL
jgi:hypothetical protein